MIPRYQAFSAPTHPPLPENIEHIYLLIPSFALISEHSERRTLVPKLLASCFQSFSKAPSPFTQLGRGASCLTAPHFVQQIREERNWWGRIIRHTVFGHTFAICNMKRCLPMAFQHMENNIVHQTFCERTFAASFPTHLTHQCEFARFCMTTWNDPTTQFRL